MIGQVLEKSGRYPKIDLSQNHLKGSDSKFIIEKVSNVDCVNLSGNSIGGEGIHSLVNLFRSPTCKIRTLDISNNKLTDSALSLLIKGIGTFPLASLNISRNQPNRKTSMQLKMLLKQNNLKYLNVGWGGLDSVSSCYIIDAVANNSSLQFFDLSWNSIGHSDKLRSSLCKSKIVGTQCSRKTLN